MKNLLFTAEEIKLVLENQYIAAIKERRARTGIGLREAKDELDHLRVILGKGKWVMEPVPPCLGGETHYTRRYYTLDAIIPPDCYEVK